MLFGGERASVPHVVTALETVGKDKLVHMYGPSESTIFTTYYPVNHIEKQALSIPIGKPVSQTAVYIVDEFDMFSRRVWRESYVSLVMDW